MIQPKTPSKLDIPTFQDLVTYYGPYLGLIIGIVIAVLILQYYWFKKVIKANEAEIKRLVEHEKDLHKRLLHFIDARIGYRGNKTSR